MAKSIQALWKRETTTLFHKRHFATVYYCQLVSADILRWTFQTVRFNNCSQHIIWSQSCLLYFVLFQAALGQCLVSLLLEGDDDQSNKDVDKEEREDHKVDYIEDGHFYAVAWTGTLVFKGGIHWMLQHTARRVIYKVNTMQSCGNAILP